LVTSVAKDTVSFFPFTWLDTSALTLVSLGEEFTQWNSDETSSREADNPLNDLPHYKIQYIQSRSQTTKEWSIVSLDMVLGLVGGLSGIIWAVLAMIFNSFESFKLENSMIGSIYPTSPQNFDDLDDNASRDEPSTNGERTAKAALMRTVADRGRYFYRYEEYMFIWLLKQCCCCFLSNSKWFETKLKRLDRHEEASEKLANEIDIVKLIYVQRVGQFIAKLILNKH